MSEACGGCAVTSVGIGGSCWHNTEHSNTLNIPACGVIIGPLSQGKDTSLLFHSPLLYCVENQHSLVPFIWCVCISSSTVHRNWAIPFNNG